MAERPTEAGQDCVATLTFKSLMLRNHSVLLPSASNWKVDVTLESEQLTVEKIDKLAGTPATSLGELQATIKQGCGTSNAIQFHVTIAGRGETNPYSTVIDTRQLTKKLACPSFTRDLKVHCVLSLYRTEYEELPIGRKDSFNPHSRTFNRNLRSIVEDPTTIRARNARQQMHFYAVFDLELTCADGDVMQNSVGGTG